MEQHMKSTCKKSREMIKMEEIFCSFCGHRVPLDEYDDDARMCKDCIDRFDRDDNP